MIHFITSFIARYNPNLADQFEAKWRTYVFAAGQIGGWSAAGMAWLDLAKGVFGVIGLMGGAILSMWAVYDKIKATVKKRRDSRNPFNRYE